MQSGVNDYWIFLCQQASVEQDPEKLVTLVREINGLVEAKRASLDQKLNDEKRSQI